MLTEIKRIGVLTGGGDAPGVKARIPAGLKAAANSRTACIGPGGTFYRLVDNDIAGPTACFGFDTAVAFATDAIDRLHTTAEAHHRIMVVEVMGRHAGWIALHAGVAGGADAILIPEIPFDIEIVAERLLARDRWGAKFSIVVVAEGAYPKGGAISLIEAAHGAYVARLGGIGAQVCASLG